MKRLILLVVPLCLAACETVPPPPPPSATSQNVTHRVDDSADGFTVSITYSQYQFVPDGGAVEAAGKIALVNLVHETARQRGKAIERINNDDIFGSISRNGLTGMTSWSGSARAQYKQ